MPEFYPESVMLRLFLEHDVLCGVSLLLFEECCRRHRAQDR